MHALLHQFRRAVSVTTDHLVMATAAASTSSGSTTGKFNRLASEKSPYLLQHATNPVDWYPWGEEAFKAAMEQNKLIFLSVGYSTCHWCHVMERESFENPQVAQIMNKHFINIKVDREERPDVDKVYMTFVTSMSGSGGWPMSVWLTPDLHPIYGGTYFPPNNRYFGRPGFTTLLEALAKQWASDEAKVRKSGTDIVSVLQKTASLGRPSEDDTPAGGEVAVKCIAQLARSYETEYGGFSDSPKFPQPSNLNFLFAYYLLHPNLDDAKTGRDMALHTLAMMARGGIHDHVSQGFARYSTDKRWHVPHFEKMLYDQAQLVHSYLDAYLVTREQLYADVVRDVLQYVTRDLSHESGGFYSAEDADSLPSADSSEKKEGAFCVWTHKEVHSLLEGMTVSSEEDEQVPVGDVFCHHYSVAVAGNVDPYKDPHDELKNQNVLIEHGSVEETAQEFSLTEAAARDALSSARQKLHERRLSRPRPHLDDKMLTAWNGMMLSAISRAAVVLSEPSYAERAAAATQFIMKYLFVPDSGTLYRSAYRGDGAQVTLGPHPTEGFCDDYAWTIRALLTLYESTLDQSHLVRAAELQKVQDSLFWDNEDGGYFLTQAGDPSILVRLKDDQDGAEPAVNSVSAGNLLRLGRLLAQQELLKKCDTILKVYGERLSKIPIALPEMATVMLMHSEPTSQVILSGCPDSPNMKELLHVVHNAPHPNRILLVAPPEEDALLYLHNPNLIKYRPKASAVSSPAGAHASGGDDDAAKAYVCCNFVCSLPVSKPDQLKNNLDQAFKTSAAAK